MQLYRKSVFYVHAARLGDPSDCRGILLKNKALCHWIKE